VFIVTYEDDALLPEALSMYADILASEGLIDEALVHYDRVISVVAKNYGAATDPYLKKQMTAPATYAVLQSAQALRLDAEAYAGRKEKEAAESKYKAIISRVEDYMKVFGEDADWAQGVFAKGKAQIALGQTDAAVKAYLETVLRYGSDPSQEGVASILFDLAEIIKTRQDEATQGKTKQIIQQERDKAASPTLQILLDVLLAELNGTRSELGKTLLLREKDLKTVPPSGLALMCMVLREMGDYSRSEELYNHFMKYHEASPFIVPAYRLRAEDLYQKKDYDAAYILASRVIDLYGACEQTGWAQLMKGNIETAQANYEEAEKTYNRIFSVRLWRGSVSAEAMFRLAELWYAQGNYDKAFAFFQRTYLLYRAHDGGRWAADAYLRSAECCMKRGREPEARNTYRAMLLDEYIRNSLQAEEAKKILGPQETEKLLAGQTNTMETVKGEVAPK
jgi:tetratricopeptide (TPR) repeat protein